MMTRIEELERKIAELQAAVKELYSCGQYVQWIPFVVEYDEEQRKDTLVGDFPAEDQEILVCDRYGNICKTEMCYDYDEGGWYLDNGYEFMTEAVAWMPLPEPYKKGAPHD